MMQITYFMQRALTVRLHLHRETACAHMHTLSLVQSLVTVCDKPALRAHLRNVYSLPRHKNDSIETLCICLVISDCLILHKIK